MTHGTRRSLTLLALTAMVALISACDSNTSTTGTGGSGGNNTAANLQQEVKFSQCMRANGVPAFPDPNPSGQFTIDGIANGSSLDANAPAFQQAMSTCKDLEPPGFTGQTRSAQQQAAALKFAKCMRDNGVPDFPDPTADGPLIDTTRIPSMAGKNPRSDPAFTAASQACSELLAAAGVSRP
jgi:hypothetical protein